MTLAPDNVTIVRNRTDEDHEKLSDAKIAELLAQYNNNVDLATAEALEFLARSTPYQSVSRGAISASGPTYTARAAYWRARGEASDTSTAQQDAFKTNVMRRADLEPGDDTTEYGFYPVTV